ncbi:sodium:solute symporter family transporter [Corallincola spongiicola]|uniref:Sodium:solute symporter n=1 Tax=Corallincola spongiicola TaxID=2520508 RepID=A0ABY1WV66_9GAMM|nr:sodium:solute symporter [Corallincola spongiicola]TAA48633.1 sodium:solute symporter [Corallincola spongiicola]
MTVLDWWVIAGYLTLMMLGAVYLGWRQKSRADYYLGGYNLPSWTLATSIIATQCSTNSLLGAPAFVGFVAGGGLLWLQYELAVPVAMLILCFAFLPLRHAGVISIYQFLEQRLGLSSRLLASGCFLVFRGVATGVTVYGVASVIALISGISFDLSVVILMGITIAYDLMGGMRAVVLSDVVQMFLLLGAVVLALVFLADPLIDHFQLISERTPALMNDWGLASGNNYGFWPMFFGGLFLYMAYYGCDQSQAQRLLSAADSHQTQRVLVMNGLLRFPLVLAYCTVGLGLAAYAIEHVDFVSSLPKTSDGSPNFNMVFPAFVSREFAPGLAGLAIVGLFAAAMSSIDSALNSLSASTVEDFIARFRTCSERQLFIYSKLSTLGWGVFAIAFSYQVERIAPTILEAINKVGSMANGPLLALFSMAVFMPSVGQRAAITGFIMGLLTNAVVWKFLPEVSWLWWNVVGFFAAWLTAMLVVFLNRTPLTSHSQGLSVPKRMVYQLVAMAAVILLFCALVTYLADT